MAVKAEARTPMSNKCLTPRPTRWLWHFLQPHRRRFVDITGLTVVTSGLTAVQPWPLKLVAVHVLGNQSLPGPLAAVWVANPPPFSPHRSYRLRLP